jgi:hypothetical protein
MILLLVAVVYIFVRRCSSSQSSLVGVSISLLACSLGRRLEEDLRLLG